MRFSKGLFVIIHTFNFGAVELAVLENVALRQKAYQTDIYYGLDASSAVDGGLSYADESCACTNNTANAFWEVDLGRTYFIDHVTIYKRDDYISNVLLLQISLDLGVVGLVHTFQLAQAAFGQWVQITRISSVVDYLTLCEVKVFAVSADQFFKIEDSLPGTETFIQASTETTSTQHCAYICHRTNGCYAASYHEDMHMCDLFASNNTQEAVNGTMSVPN